jgi:peptidoglycan/LPS O-acetylase OafA/YrhL
LTGLAGVLLLVAVMAIVYRQDQVEFRAIIIINDFLIPLPVAVLYWGLIREKTVLSRLLSGNIAGLLGRSSYSFYLLHTLIINYVGVPFLSSHGGFRPFYVLVALLFTWIASILLFVGYEEPLNILIRRVFKSKEKTTGMQSTLIQVKP